jgi:hypothetical protein
MNMETNTSISECPTRKHDYEFLGNHKIVKAQYGPNGSRVQFSVRAFYKCRKCGKQRIAAGNPKAPWPQF